MSHHYREHHQTVRPKVWTAKSVLVCFAIICALAVAYQVMR